ncbi:hypothetical protein HY933_00550 [Candidatus Falkowbacteria bacterium]|nr:hypothetical protein [Candidatus Falkowbacteria bacterium]
MPAQALSLVPGDLIKAADSSTVYYYGYDGQRHAFPHSSIYFSWYDNFDRVKTVSKADLASINLGKNIMIRPGTYLVKLVSDPKVYAVEPEGVLRYIESVSQAATLYGGAWQSRVIDLADAFYGDYTSGGSFDSNRHPTGTVFRYDGEGDYYVLTNGYSRKFLSRVSWDSYHFSTRFILNVPYQNFRYKVGDDIQQYKVALSDTAQTLMGDERSDLITYSKAGSTTGSGTGLNGYYYSGESFETLKYQTVDSQVNFNWGTGAPNSGLDQDRFSVRWAGKVEIESAKNVTFYIYSDDGVRLSIDDKLVINDWKKHPLKWNEGTVSLTAGFHTIDLEYFENTGQAEVHLYWDSKTTLVPSNRLYVK